MKHHDTAGSGWLLALLGGVVLGCTPRTAPIPPEPTPTPVVVWTSASALRGQDPVALRDEALARIAALDRVGPSLGAVIAVDPGAAAVGDGPLRGLPVLVKDNVDVRGFPTTAGSLFLADNEPPDDAFTVARLREAGAVVLGKANLSEWANFRSTRSTSGWSAVGGQVKNPYALDRNPCGSSSGSAVAVAAGYVPFAVATETDGSILCPAAINGVVGVKPTVGLVSRDGIVPISHSQDTAGPVAVDVASAALLLSVLAAADPADPASARRPPDLDTDYVAALSPDALRGVRIGAARTLSGGFSPDVLARFDAAIADLERLGATVVDVPLTDEGLAEPEFEVLLHEFRPDLEAYLAAAGHPTPTLGAAVAFHEAHAEQEMPWFGQELFLQAAAHAHDPVEGAPPDYAAAVATLQAAGPERIDAALQAHDVVAIVAPTAGPAWLTDLVNGDHYTGGTSTITAVTGYPAVTVPMGRVAGLPVGLTFLGAAFDEARLLALAHAYEQGTHHAAPPTLAPSVTPTAR